MNIVRYLLAVISGYTIFVVSAILLFQLSGIDPHADPSIGVILLTVAYGLIFSFIGGFLTQLIAKTRELSVNYVLSGIIAGFALFSLFKSPGNHYSQLAAIFLFAPASTFGGFTYLKKWKH